MRIEIHSGGASSVLALDNGLLSLHTNISSTIESLQNIAHKLDNVTGGAGNLTPAIESVQKRINSEQTKLAKVERFRSKVTQFISNTVNTDAQVAHTVIVNQEKFFNKYSWLRPPVPVEEPKKSGWDRFCEGWNKFWGGAGEKISRAWNGIKNFVKEHAVELIVGTVAIVVGAAIVALTGGTAAAFLPALAAGFKVAAISAATSGAISAVIAGFKGENVLQAFGDGAASGYMWGGIFFAGGAVVSKVSSAKSAISNPQARANYNNGKLFEQQRFSKFKAQNKVREITIRPNGLDYNIRVDAIGYAKDGKTILIQEYKSGMKGGFRAAQKFGYDKLFESGGIIRGQGKGLFSGGKIIPPGVKVDIIRPDYGKQFLVNDFLKKIVPRVSIPGGVAGAASK